MGIGAGERISEKLASPGRRLAKEKGLVFRRKLQQSPANEVLDLPSSVLLAYISKVDGTSRTRTGTQSEGTQHGLQASS